MAPTGPTDETTLGAGSAAETRRASTPSHSGWLSSSQPGDGRFASGTILADRYRIVGLLGRGGMGEVYRADDLRLGQPVALKFLPQAVTGDSVRLAQFHNEVRVARQVSHRNVCRVYDIGEADGEHLPDDGVRRRGGSGVAAAADRTVSAGSGDRDRAAVVRRDSRRRTNRACCTAT